MQGLTRSDVVTRKMGAFESQEDHKDPDKETDKYKDAFLFAFFDVEHTGVQPKIDCRIKRPTAEPLLTPSLPDEASS